MGAESVGSYPSRYQERVAYHCRFMVCTKDRCSCLHGEKLGLAKDGSLDKVSLLVRGVTPKVCRKCARFDKAR